MYDIKNKRKFLNRTRLPQMPEKLLIGTKLSIHARQHCIVDYGDDKTRKVNHHEVKLTLRKMYRLTSFSYEIFSGAHRIQRDHLWDYFGAAIHRENYQQYSKHWSKSKCKTEIWKSNFLKVTNLKSVKLTDQLQNELGISQPNVVAIQVTGLQSLEKFKNMVDKSGCKCVKAAGSLLEANKWVLDIFVGWY